jgi:hypothetical protein
VNLWEVCVFVAIAGLIAAALTLVMVLLLPAAMR